MDLNSWQKVQEGWWYNHPNFGWRPCNLCEAVTAFDEGWLVSLGCPPDLDNLKGTEFEGYDPERDFALGDCGC